MSADPLFPEVLAMLEKETGIGSKESWRNCFLLVSKSEHDNENPTKAFLTDKGESVFTYADAINDKRQRGVTMGLVGFTTADAGKDGHGDAMPLFATYKRLGGPDLAPLAKGCCTDQHAQEAMIKAVKKAGSDLKWVLAQWSELFKEGGYLRETMQAWKKLGIDKPSALAIAVTFDSALNFGCEGSDGACKFLVKLGKKGDEAATLDAYCKWKAKIGGKNDYNSSEKNGKARGDMFGDLVKAKCFHLIDCDKEIKKAVSWKMV